jgi:hypothetical protein
MWAHGPKAVDHRPKAVDHRPKAVDHRPKAVDQSAAAPLHLDKGEWTLASPRTEIRSLLGARRP